MVLKNILRTTALGLQTWSVFSGARQASIAVSAALRQSTCSSFSYWTLTRNFKGDETLPNQPVRQYARPSRKKQEFPSQLQDLHPSLLKHEYASVPLAQSVDDVVKKLLTLEFANHSEKLRLKEEQLIAKVQRDENDRTSTEVKVAIMTARIRNFQEHLHKHPKDKANKRWMLMTIDSRKKKLKFLRRTRYESFVKVCQELGITYTFPPEYYRRVTRRWLAKKAFCNKVFKEVQKQKAEQREKQKATEAKEKELTSSK
ncbi:28S ribosomal protein S15, mitochondrial [Pimephales promelas]|uniref:28S ribosomal protein S15, mitochondrial n=1 Tax=Pimephales promelas TaxID=90988 RepID=UPI0019559642|nr:28S ribosomal protein S15, mitochondrial [Pimephales promelas]KAG1948208.1 30S ribosomal protein S15 [Pimephales promelas]